MITSFRKTDTQKDAVKKIIASRSKNIMLYGGSRSGKSFLAVYIMIVRACKIRCDQIIVRNTFNSIKNSIWMETLPAVFRVAFPDLPVSWDKTNYIATLPNGSTLRCAGLDDGDKLERLLGLEFSGIQAEECNQIPFVAIEKLKTRLAQRNDLKKIVLYTQNPTHKSSAYYQLFEQGINPQDGEAMDEEQRGDYLSIRMNVQGNLQNIDKDYVKMLEKLPEAERKRFLYGEYAEDNAGAAIYAFVRDECVSEEAVRLEGTDWVGSDFNYVYNSDVLVSQHASGSYVWDEVQIEGDTFKKCDALKKKGVTGATIICDSTGRNRSTKGKSDHHILKEAGFQVQFKTNPAVKDKIANLNRCFSLGLIKVNPRCKKLIRDLTQLVWDKNGQLDQKTDPSLSHLVDGLAYYCWVQYPLVARKPSRLIQL